MDHNKKEISFNINNIVIYLFAAISAIAALILIYLIGLDFVDPIRMSSSLQMMNLSEDEIILLDLIETFICAVLLTLVVIGLITKRKKLTLTASASIWLFISIDIAVIEPIFRYKII